MRLLFGDCVRDPQRRELSRGGAPVHLEPQVFDLLLHLIRNRDHVVSKDELLAAVWQGRIISESTLSNRVNAAPSTSAGAAWDSPTAGLITDIPVPLQRALACGRFVRRQPDT